MMTCVSCWSVPYHARSDDWTRDGNASWSFQSI